MSIGFFRCRSHFGVTQCGGAGRSLSVNKRKILESARKLAQKGSKEKALAGGCFAPATRQTRKDTFRANWQGRESRAG